MTRVSDDEMWNTLRDDLRSLNIAFPRRRDVSIHAQDTLRITCRTVVGSRLFNSCYDAATGKRERTMQRLLIRSIHMREKDIGKREYSREKSNILVCQQTPPSPKSFSGSQANIPTSGSSKSLQEGKPTDDTQREAEIEQARDGRATNEPDQSRPIPTILVNSSPLAPSHPDLEQSGDASDQPSINEYVTGVAQELAETRQVLAAIQEQEKSLVTILRLFKHPASDPSLMSEAVNASAVIDLEERLKEASVQLENERRRHTVLEILLQDIEREQKEPFIIPQLLSAFIQISKIVTAADANSL